MKKFLSLVVVGLSIFVFSACSSQSEQVDVDKKQESNESETEKPINLTRNVNESLSFNQFNVDVQKIKVYEKKGKLLADIHLDWHNKTSDEMTLFVATLLDVKQGGNLLTEINDSLNPANKNSSDVFFPNAPGGSWGVKLTYELTDKETHIDIIFTPTTETEESKVVSVKIQ